MPACSYSNLYDHVKYLASDKLEGRYPGTSGDMLAARYIQSQFQKCGLDLLGKNGFQEFDFINSIILGENNLLSFENNNYLVGNDFMPISFGKSSSLSAELFIAGYGFDINEDSLYWNDYEGNDLSGKWVMIFRGAPDGNNPHGKYSEHSSLRTKALVAKDNLAAGVIFVSGYDFDPNDDLIELSYEHGQQDIGIPVIHIKRYLADLLLKDVNTNIEDIELQINQNKQNFNNFFVKEVIDVKTSIVYEKKKTQNVIGFIEGTNDDLKDEYIVVGAHYDHIGYGGDGSGSRRPYLNAIHNGADDNASGVSILLELAKSLKKIKVNRSILFVAFGAEEMGLLGSKHFVNSDIVSSEKIQIMVNMDMVGRLNEEKVLSINGTKTAVGLEELIVSIIDKTEFDYVFSSEGYGPSDHSSFYSDNVPVLFFFTGAHTDYHTPHDDYDKLNYKGMMNIQNLMLSLIVLMDDSEKLMFQKAGSSSKGRPVKFRVTLGIMPDYVSIEEKGLRIDVVLPGKPADNAGLINGDLIVSIDGKSVGDIYEYMHRLSELSPGQKANVVVIRNKIKLEYLVTF